MKTHASNHGPVVVALLAFCITVQSWAAGTSRVFPTPEEAINSLGAAVNTTNRAEFVALFGADAEKLVNPDTVQGAKDLAEFTAAFNVTNRLDRESDSKMILEVGGDLWPFPIPIVKSTNGWRFDTAAGLEELLDRRIGRNELDVLRVMRAYVNAQREYASRDRDGDEVLEYAQQLASSPGLTDGLYWPSSVNGEISPLGPLVAYAQGEGYFKKGVEAEEGPRPFHGYLFKILKQQGKHAPGGKYNYVINGHMIGGFAMVAWPVEYGESGIMTFIVNQQGRVYQKDLAATTEKVAGKMTTYDPDPTWQVSAD